MTSDSPPSSFRSPPLQSRDSFGTNGPLSPQSPPTPSTPTSLRGIHPLSTKVTSVLSASYADSDFRDALALLDERKLQNTAESRRQLRQNLQREVIESNGQIINEFGRVAEQLKRIGSTIDRLNKSYNDMKGQIKEAHESTGPVLEEASSLMCQRRQVETKQQLLKAFRDHFVLSEDEVAALTLNSEPVDDRFFAILSKAKRISRDCEVLLGFENQTLGLEIMENTSKDLNLAFQKLYRWIQREFKTLNLENPQIGAAIRRALRVLAERPTLFQNCLDFFAEAREHILSDSFYAALTGSSAKGKEDHTIKPIELAAHDPLRYAGDMLAWIHSAAVSEREALEVLFISDGGEIAKGIQEGRENEIWRLADEDGEVPAEFDAGKALNDLVDRDLSSAARILRQRVEQVIHTNEETILAYKLANLLNFYRLTFSKLLSAESVLVEALNGLEAEALRQFRSLMKDHITSIQGDFLHPPSDFSPPDFLQDALKQLTAIMKTYETSLTSSGNREADFQPILAEAFDPFIEGCKTMAGNIRAPDDTLFTINCLMAARATISPFDFTQARAEEILAEIEDVSHRLVDSQYIFFRMESGLDSVFTAVTALTDKKEDVAKVWDLDELQPPRLSQASQSLDDFLPSALMDAMEGIKHLQDAQLARQITEDAAERFCVEFEHVEEMLMTADEQAEQESGDINDNPPRQSLRGIFPRTTGEIRVLLS